MVRTFNVSKHVTMALAVMGALFVTGGVTGLTTGVASAQTNASAPVTRQDCANWRDFANNFKNRGDCVSYVEHQVHGNGYGGGGNGGGNGGLGSVIHQLFSFLSHLLTQLFAFLGHLF